MDSSVYSPQPRKEAERLNICQQKLPKLNFFFKKEGRAKYSRTVGKVSKDIASTKLEYQKKKDNEDEIFEVIMTDKTREAGNSENTKINTKTNKQKKNTTKTKKQKPKKSQTYASVFHIKTT